MVANICFHPGGCSVDFLEAIRWKKIECFTF